jgi:hypothetical protein
MKNYNVNSINTIPAKAGSEDTSRPTIGIESLHKVVMIMELESKLCHVQKCDCREYNGPTS